MYNDKKETVEEKKKRLREALLEKSNLIKSVFDTYAGKKLMEALEEEFNKDNIFSQCQNTTNYNLGRRDVVIYLKELLKYKPKGVK